MKANPELPSPAPDAGRVEMLGYAPPDREPVSAKAKLSRWLVRESWDAIAVGVAFTVIVGAPIVLVDRTRLAVVAAVTIGLLVVWVGFAEWVRRLLRS